MVETGPPEQTDWSPLIEPGMTGQSVVLRTLSERCFDFKKTLPPSPLASNPPTHEKARRRRSKNCFLPRLFIRVKNIVSMAVIPGFDEFGVVDRFSVRTNRAI